MSFFMIIISNFEAFDVEYRRTYLYNHTQTRISCIKECYMEKKETQFPETNSQTELSYEQPQVIELGSVAELTWNTSFDITTG